MRSRYYVVGAAIQDLDGNFFIGLYPKHYTQETLLSLSFYKNHAIRVFVSYDEAKTYALGLRENAYAYSFYPRTDLSNSKINPIFTVELGHDMQLGDIQEEQFVYNVYQSVNANHMARQDIKTMLHFYVVESEAIKQTDIIRAEFYDPTSSRDHMPSVEFEHVARNDKCLMM